MLFSLSRMAKTGAFYAVAIGRQTGVYRSWDMCKQQVDKFRGARYKKFDVEQDALNFIKTHGKKQEALKPTSSLVLSGSRKRSASSAFSGSGIVTNGLTMTKKRPSVNPIRNLHSLSDPNSGNIQERDESSKSTSTKLIEDSDGFIHVYTDGACESNGREEALAGIGVWFNHNHSFNVAAPVTSDHRQTNNVAEILAAKEAIDIARKQGLHKLRILTDSQFLINCVTKWMEGWKRRNWITASKRPVANKQELELLDDALNDVPEVVVQWQHVNGHKGIEGNEMADQLAREGARKR